MKLPCVLHVPDSGTIRIDCSDADSKLEYDARRFVAQPFVNVSFPPARRSKPLIEYDLEVVSLHPALKGIESDPLFDGFRRNYLNIFQVNPRIQMLANNASSDACAFTLNLYSEVALQAPPLAKNLTCLDLVRMSLDRYLAGTKAYGMVGYGKEKSDADLVSWSTPHTSLDSYPSLLIAACNYVHGSKDTKWARHNYDRLLDWANEMISADSDGNGLIEYPESGNLNDRPTVKRRPSNWWDTINFGHEDAYANALAYRAATLFADMSAALEKKEEAKRFSERAEKIRMNYVPTFLDPQTGVLAGWKSADGRLHDYWFTFVNGVAISYGLVDDKTANSIMDKLLHKMDEVGFTNFNLGLPGNLVPIPKADYINENRDVESARSIGQPQLEDGSDAFQYYENGGATGCYTYFTIRALYRLGRDDDARRIFIPMLRSFATGDFQGFDQNGKSKDWRDWSGGGHGYEGFLVDNYLALLAVFDEANSRSRTNH